MMRVVSETSVRLRWLIIVVAVIVLFFGADAISDLPIEIWPEVGPPIVEVQTEALGLSAAEVESLITVPMEADLLNGVAWMERITSKSVNSLSSITLTFEKGTDPIRARQMVSERLTQAYALPNVSAPPTMLPPLSSTSRLMMIGLSSADVSPIDLSVLARWNIKPRLMGVPGVANVAIWGQRERQLQVQVDPKRLNFQGVTLDQVIETAGNALWVSPLSFLNASTPGTAGWIDTPNQRLGLHHILPIVSAEDLAKVPVVGSERFSLGDVADVVEDHQPLIGEAQASGESADLLLVVEKFPRANTLEVTEQVEDALAALSSGMAGVDVDTTVFRPATYLEEVRGNVALAGILSIVFFGLVLEAFLNDWRAVFMAVAVMSVTVAVAALVLYWSGLTINAMAAAGLAAAAATIAGWVTINVVRSQGMRFFAPVTLLLALVPIFIWPGSAGAWLPPAVLTYVLGLLVYYLVSITVAPALGSLLRRHSPNRAVSPVMVWLAERYEYSLTRLEPAARLAPAGLAALALVSIFISARLDFPARPAFHQRDLLLTWQGAPAASLPEMRRLTARLREELTALPGVDSVGAQVGRAVAGDTVAGINAGQLWISLEEAANYDDAVEAVGRVTAGYSGLAPQLTTYQPQELPTEREGRELTVRIYGHDFDELATQSENVRERLARVPGITHAQVQQTAREPQVEIEVDLAAAEKWRIKPGDVRRQAAALLSGIQVGNLFEEQKVFGVVVWGTPTLRKSLTDVARLQIDTPVGLVPLEDVAKVRVASAPAIISREAVSRYVDVAARLNGRSAGSVRREIKTALAETSFPLEYHAEVLEDQGGRPARAWFTGAAMAAAVGIFLVLQASLRSWRAAAIFFLALPAALSGGVVAAWLTGGTLGVGSLLGLIVVLALTLGSGMAPPRFVPTVAALSAVALFLLPFIMLGGLAGYELLQPLAVAALGGLVTAALVTLWGLPLVSRAYG